MKTKSIYLLLFAALTIGFAACNDDSSEPNGSNDNVLDPAALIGTMWRTDSVKANGVQQPAPHFIVKVYIANRAVINSDTVDYSFDGYKLTCDKGIFEIKDYAGTTAKLVDDNGLEMYICKLPASDTEIKDVITEDDFIGTWKYAYCDHTQINSLTHKVDYSCSTNRGVETWTFEKGGNVIYHNTFTGETSTGSWEWVGGLKFYKSPVEGDPVDEHIAVQPLGNNWMGQIRSDGTSYSNHWWYYKVD